MSENKNEKEPFYYTSMLNLRFNLVRANGVVLTAILILLLVSSTLNAQWSDPPSDEIVIRGGWLFDGISNTRRQNTGIVIREGRIVEIDANIQGKALTATSVVDLTDSETILPGMIDLHAHYNFDLIDVGRVEEVVNNGIKFLAN
jgi:hypothetical protein